MALYLVRHAQAHSEKDDPLRRLTDAGKKSVDRIAAFVADSVREVSLIRHSGKARARETAEIMAQHLEPACGLEEIPGINPDDNVTTIAGSLDPRSNVMLVSHLPFLERLISFLITGSSEMKVINFRQGGVVCVDQDTHSQFWHIEWALMPEMLRK